MLVIFITDGGTIGQASSGNFNCSIGDNDDDDDDNKDDGSSVVFDAADSSNSDALPAFLFLLFTFFVMATDIE